jgi:hypothetical protein
MPLQGFRTPRASWARSAFVPLHSGPPPVARGAHGLSFESLPPASGPRPTTPTVGSSANERWRPCVGEGCLEWTTIRRWLQFTALESGMPALLFEVLVDS